MAEQATQSPPAGALTAADAGILTLLLGANLAAMASDIMMGALVPALAQRFSTGVETIVWLTTPRALAQLGVLVLGPLSDRLGRARVLIGGLFLLALAGWGNALAPSLAVMVVPQVAIGLGYATVLACIKALVGDRYVYAIRGRILAIVQMALPLTLIVVVPALVALAYRAGAAAAFAVVGGAATALALLAAWLLPGAARHSHAPAGSEEAAASWLQPRIIATLGLAVVMTAVSSGVFNFLSVWVTNTYGDPGRTVGLAIAGDGVGTLAGILTGAVLIDRLTKRRAAVLGVTVAGAFTLLLPWTRVALGLTLAGIAGLSAGLEVALIALSALLTQLAPRARGMVMSLWVAAMAGGTALSPLVAGFLWRQGGMEAIGTVGGAVVLAVAVALAVVAREPRAAG